MNVGENALILASDGLNDVAKTYFNANVNGVKFYVSAYEKELLLSTDTKIYATVNPYKTYKDIYCCYNMAFNRAKVLAKHNNVFMVVNNFSAYFRALENILSDKVNTEVKLVHAVKEEILNALSLLKQAGVVVVICDTTNLEQHIKNFILFELSNVVDYFDKI